MNIKKVAAVVILYNPDESVWDNIASYIDYVEILYLIDNSPQLSILGEKLSALLHVKLLHSGSNIGVAKALNIALEYALKDKHTWIMTMDQDTSFYNEDMSLFVDSFVSICTQDVALVSPLHNKNGIQKNIHPLYVEKEYVMTSANIVNVKIAKKIGGYREAFFIDEIDHDFCFRLATHGYVILQNISLAVNHSLGRVHDDKANITIYPASRLYYMVRNYLTLKNEYQKTHQDFFKQRDSYLRQFLMSQIRYGKNRLKNVYMILRGLLDYRLGRYGKVIDE